MTHPQFVLLHDWSVPIAEFTVGYANRVVTEAPYRYLKLVSCSHDTRRFEVYDDHGSLYSKNKYFGFKTFDIISVSWSERNNKVMIQCQQGGYPGQPIFIDLMLERDVQKFFDKLAYSERRPSIQSISRQVRI